MPITKHDIPSDPSRTVYPIFWGVVLDQGHQAVSGLDADGYVAAGGVMQNLRSTPSRVEITVAVIDAMTGKQVDFTQAKSGVLQPNESQTYTAAVYDVTTGQSSVPMYMTVKCRVTNVTAMDPDAIG
jgi:hypothetical protein